MTSAIARWHSSARPPSDALELAYADRLEAEMQELAIQLHKVCGERGEGRGDPPAEKDTLWRAVGTDGQGQQGEAARAGGGAVRAESATACV